MLAAVAVWLVPLAAMAIGGPPVGGPLGAEMSALQLAFVYFWPLSRLPEFVLGMIAARTDAPPFGVVASGALVIGSLALGVLFLPAPFQFAAVTAVPLALLIRATAAADQQQRFSWLRTRVMEFLGDISYAFYLVHFTVFMVVLHFFGTTNALVVLAVTLVVSWLLHALVERPCMRRFAVRRRAPAEVIR